MRNLNELTIAKHKTDAYRVFNKMLKNGNPPDDWNDLLEAAKGEAGRLKQIAKSKN